VLNAYVGPRVGDYLDTLERRLDASHFRGDLLIMQSNGGVMAASTARALPIATLESGPVGGFTAAARTAERLGYRRAIAFDMGGTTAKANLILDGQPQMARGYHIGGYATGQPMTLPVVDTVEVGAGGGSLARALAGGGLEVGPESAGADPGPACYGKGGALATVTDANVVLGRIDPHAFLGGEITLDADAARVAVGHVAERLGLTLPDAALAIVQVAVLKMSLAVRQVSVERGYDPRDFAMVAFGGAGPLHASDVARALHVPVVVVPLYPGQFSAAGMLLADRRHDYVRTCDRPFDLNDAADLAGLHAIASDLEVTARARLGSERSGAAPAAMSFSLDVRYAGQDFSLAVPLENSFFSHRDGEAVKARFGELHQRSFGYHEPGHALEVVTVRLAAVSPRPLDRPFEFSVASETPGSAVSRPVWFEARQPVECPVYRRDTLPPGRLCSGPAIVQEYASTTLLAPGDRMQVTPSGDFVIQLRAD
jgi:N-methylhydantoinase A